MKIAIIGAGFCGLATAWYLFQLFPSCSVTLFDLAGIGGGTSGIAAGLLHPYAGAHAKLNRMGREGMEATLQLLDVSSQALQRPIAFHQGILRPALTQEQQEDFLLCQTKYPEDVKWLDKVQCHALYSHLVEAPGLWIKQGIIVNSPLYLQGLWKACHQKGATFITKRVTNWNELEGFDIKILTLGAATHFFEGLSSLPLSIVKGQVIELEWPHHLPPLPFALNSQAYVIMNEHQTSCLAGATFEREDFSMHPNLERAMQEIMPKVIEMLPDLGKAKPIKCYAGLRAVTPTHLPLIKQIDGDRWILTGMGSKGLLYHALMAKKLVEQLKLNPIKC